MLLTIIFLITPLNGAVIKDGFLATTSTGAVVVIETGKKIINNIITMVFHLFFPEKYFFIDSLIGKVEIKELKA